MIIVNSSRFDTSYLLIVILIFQLYVDLYADVLSLSVDFSEGQYHQDYNQSEI